MSYDLCRSVGHQGQTQLCGPGSPRTNPGISYPGFCLWSTERKRCLQKVVDVLLTSKWLTRSVFLPLLTTDGASVNHALH